MRIVASYRLGIGGYVAGTALSLLGEVPAGAMLLTATSLAAIALFVLQVIHPRRAKAPA